MKIGFHASHEQFRPSTLLDGSVPADLRPPAQLDAAAQLVGPGDLRGTVHTFSDTDEHVRRLKQVLELGFDPDFSLDVNLGRKRFIEDFGEKVLSAFRE